MAHFRLYIFYHNEKQLLKNIYYLMWAGLHQAAGTVYKQGQSAHPHTLQAEPSPGWRPAPQWVGMGGDLTWYQDPNSPFWQGSYAHKVSSVCLSKMKQSFYILQCLRLCGNKKLNNICSAESRDFN